MTLGVSWPQKVDSLAVISYTYAGVSEEVLTKKEFPIFTPLYIMEGGSNE